MTTCKVIIQDEVNVSIKNLSLDTRKALVKKFKYVDPTAKYRPAYKLGRWDGAISFFGLGGSTYLSILGQVLEFIESQNYDIELEDLRTSPALSFDMVTEDFWGDKCWPTGHRFEGLPIRLRDDQVEVVNIFLENPQCIQSIVTGAGKTIITATLVKVCEKYGRTVTIVPNKSLVEQTEEDFVNCGLDVGVYYGDRKELGKTHIICTWQSLNSMNKRSKDDDELISLSEFLHDVNTVIVDEAHSIQADVLKDLLTKNIASAPIRWGLTGTIPKQEIDQMNLRVSIGEVVNHVNARDLQDKGILSKCHVNIIQTAEWKEFGSYAEELKYLVTDKTRIEYLSKLIQTISESGNTLVLVDRLEAGRMIQSYLNDTLGTAEEPDPVSFISGEIKTKDRKEEYDEIRVSTNKIIVASYGVAAVGISINRIFNLVLIEPGKSFVRVIQSIGRGLRVADDKDFVNIYDITATTKYAKRHLTERKRFYKEANYPFTIEKIKYI